MADYDTKGLDKLLKALKGTQPYVKVGILGSKSSRGGGTTNAEIGAAHEFGTSTIPQRSFIRMPISEVLQKRLETSGAFDKDAMAKVLRTGSVLAWVEKLAVLAESVIGEAFDSAGFGRWPALDPKTMAAKKVEQILVETQQLRNSISSEVVGG